MKTGCKFVIMMLLSVLLFSCVDYNPDIQEESPYKTVIIIGMDGAGGSYVEAAETQSIDALKSSADCAYTFKAHCELPSSSAQNWGALLHGVTPDKLKRDNGVICAQRFRNTKYPSIFALFRKAFPACYTASVVNWNPINYGLIETYADADKYPDLIFSSGLYNDKEVKDIVIDCLKKDPKLVFVQFDGADETGHSYGYGSDEHKNVIKELDGYIGEIYEACDKESTLFIIVADHGGTEAGNHGGASKEEQEIIFLIKGKTINGNADVSAFKSRDLVPVVLSAMNMAVPKTMDGTVPSDLFLANGLY